MWLHRVGAALLILCPATASPCLGQADVGIPRAVNKPTLTYFPEKKVAVLFGGWPQRGVPLGETWLLKDGCWRKLDISGPPARGGHAAAYDSRRRRMVLFGGEGVDGKPLADTWEFDGEKWEQKLVPGPAARVLLRMVFDPKRGRVILFGGSQGAPTTGHFGDTWAWNGSAWRKLSDSGPGARFEHGMVFDARQNTLVIFGGNRGGPDWAAGSLRDSWLYSAGKWTQAFGVDPPKRDHHAMAYHAARSVVLLFGGNSDQGWLGDTWVWDGKTWRELAPRVTPSARGGVPAMTYDSHRKKIVMYGGWGKDGPLQDLWEWDGEWTKVHDVTPTCPLSTKPH
jgi:hypothetical protein